MPTEFELIRDLTKLPEESRTSLADALCESSDDILDEGAARLWLEEIGRRHAEIPVDQVMREARAVFGWKTFRGR